MIRRAALLAVALLLALPGLAVAAAPRTSLEDVEDEVMCVVCGTPLNVSESPAADQERALIRREVAAGKTKQQVKQALVAEYGPQVLATPQGGGFAAAAWLVPLAVVAGLVALVAVLLPRWRRRAATAPARLAPLDPADARRLDEELGRYDPSL